LIFGKLTSLREAIVALLSKREQATAAWLHTQVNENLKKCSLVAVYKELNRLQDEGIVTKAGKQFSLKLTWVINAAGFFNEMFLYQCKESQHPQLIPEEGQAIHWYFSDLSKVDDLWEQLLFALFMKNKESILLSWMPHPWYHITDDAKQRLYENAMSLINIRIYRIIGGDTYLDRKCMEDWGAPVQAVSFATSPFAGDTQNYIDVIGDYVITIKLDANTAGLLEDFYNSIVDEASLAAIDSQTLLSRKMKIKVKIQHNTRKARHLQKKFREFWGLPRYRSSAA
jgi:hypothetical protein